ncbi:MAG TPA: hypothetical protein VGS10_13530 [Terracidiphilus sp.]|nr:hypothetical protein [Terracidiphilus sp.]
MGENYPPAWVRILIVSFFCLIAFGATHTIWTTSYRRVPANWIIPSLFWLIAIVVAIDVFIPRSGRQWTGFLASGAFGTIAILTVAGIVHHGGYISEWVFPILMAALSVGLAVLSVRERKRGVREEKGGVVP